MIIAVSAALKTVTVANPRGLAVAESVIFPFNVPWDHDKLHIKKVVITRRNVFFMLLVMAIQKTNLYDIIRIRRVKAAFSFIFV